MQQRQPMNPESKASRCLAVLADGPATTAEVAAELGMPHRLVSAHLNGLVNRGKAKKRLHSCVPYKVNVWMLPEHAKP